MVKRINGRIDSLLKGTIGLILGVWATMVAVDGDTGEIVGWTPIEEMEEIFW